MPASRRFGIVLAFTLLLTSMSALTPAHANNCQPDEFVFGEDGGPYDKRDSAVCFVLDTWVYPFLCREGDVNGNQNGEIDPMECAANIDPDLNNPPDLTQITNFNPSAFRIYCNAYLWIWDRLNQTATCTFLSI